MAQTNGGEDVQVYMKRQAIARQGLKPQSFVAVAKSFFLKKMATFYPVKIEKEVEGKTLKIGFCRYGNKHLLHDAFGNKKSFNRGDLLNLPSLLTKAVYVKSSPITKPRKDNITKFHYFRTRVRGEYVYLNVGEETSKSGKVKRRYVYSVTEKIRAPK